MSCTLDVTSSMFDKSRITNSMLVSTALFVVQSTYQN